MTILWEGNQNRFTVTKHNARLWVRLSSSFCKSGLVLASWVGARAQGTKNGNRACTSPPPPPPTINHLLARHRRCHLRRAPIAVLEFRSNLYRLWNVFKGWPVDIFTHFSTDCHSLSHKSNVEWRIREIPWLCSNSSTGALLVMMSLWRETTQ